MSSLNAKLSAQNVEKIAHREYVKEWSTAHEVAWSWLWDNVERVLQKTFGSPVKWEVDLDVGVHK
eukprot:3910585-Amphidinium_carterae.3